MGRTLNRSRTDNELKVPSTVAVGSGTNTMSQKTFDFALNGNIHKTGAASESVQTRNNQSNGVHAHPSALGSALDVNAAAAAFGGKAALDTLLAWGDSQKNKFKPGFQFAEMASNSFFFRDKLTSDLPTSMKQNKDYGSWAKQSTLAVDRELERMGISTTLFLYRNPHEKIMALISLKYNTMRRLVLKDATPNPIPSIL